MISKTSLQETIQKTTSGEISPVDLVEYSYEQIEKHNPSLNAIVSLKKKSLVIKEAESLFKKKNNEQKLLFGIPLAVKDLFDVKDLPTTFGLPRFKNNIAKKNSILVTVSLIKVLLYWVKRISRNWHSDLKLKMHCSVPPQMPLMKACQQEVPAGELHRLAQPQ